MGHVSLKEMCLHCMKSVSVTEIELLNQAISKFSLRA